MRSWMVWLRNNSVILWQIHYASTLGLLSFRLFTRETVTYLTWPLIGRYPNNVGCVEGCTFDVLFQWPASTPIKQYPPINIGLNSPDWGGKNSKAAYLPNYTANAVEYCAEPLFKAHCAFVFKPWLSLRMWLFILSLVTLRMSHPAMRMRSAFIDPTLFHACFTYLKIRLFFIT